MKNNYIAFRTPFGYKIIEASSVKSLETTKEGNYEIKINNSDLSYECQKKDFRFSPDIESALCIFEREDAKEKKPLPSELPRPIYIIKELPKEELERREIYPDAIGRLIVGVFSGIDDLSECYAWNYTKYLAGGIRGQLYITDNIKEASIQSSKGAISLIACYEKQREEGNTTNP